MLRFLLSGLHNPRYYLTFSENVISVCSFPIASWLHPRAMAASDYWRLCFFFLNFLQMEREAGSPSHGEDAHTPVRNPEHKLKIMPFCPRVGSLYRLQCILEHRLTAVREFRFTLPFRPKLCRFQDAPNNTPLSPETS